MIRITIKNKQGVIENTVSNSYKYRSKCFILSRNRHPQDCSGGILKRHQWVRLHAIPAATPGGDGAFPAE
ncbi:hypothetical protein HanRHA438_Chr03g0124751 [Helianthus annuus]|nr:hypothetical protein HanIR_Chr03g0123211 [Helianthus annuus]KAJ0935899.1 hypothetical protein HanRHA438_Chr03g0124751 [Helianthus annuus]